MPVKDERKNALAEQKDVKIQPQKTKLYYSNCSNGSSSRPKRNTANKFEREKMSVGMIKNAREKRSTNKKCDNDAEDKPGASNSLAAVDSGETVGNPVSCKDLRLSTLNYEQVNRLNEVMNEVISIEGRGNFPAIEVSLKDLVITVRDKLQRDDEAVTSSDDQDEEEFKDEDKQKSDKQKQKVRTDRWFKVRDIRLNGGAASYVLDTEECWQTYNDLDLIFSVELSSGKHFDRVKSAVLSSLLDLLPAGVSRKRMSACSMKEAYVSKMVKVNKDGDCWSLISIGSGGCGASGDGFENRSVELKFVDTMRRPFEFSVDSFHIVLDPLLTFYQGSVPLTEDCYPTVVGESMYGNFQEAFYHLRKKLIATRNPEEIRGGGLLKYCYLLARNYQPADLESIRMLERYMCSRFFIDFSDIRQQRSKLENYLWNHFVGPEEEPLKYHYLSLLRSVVAESTVCLMGHERRQTLSLIDELAYKVYYSIQLQSRRRKFFQQPPPSFPGPHFQQPYQFFRPAPPGYYISAPLLTPSQSSGNSCCCCCANRSCCYCAPLPPYAYLGPYRNQQYQQYPPVFAPPAASGDHDNHRPLETQTPSSDSGSRQAATSAESSSVPVTQE